MKRKPAIHYRNQFEQLQQELTTNKSVELATFDVQFAESDSVKDRSADLIHDSVRQFFDQIESITFTWTSKIHDNADITGSIKILPLDRVLIDWKDDIYFDDDSPEELRRSFHPFDFFVPEAAVGILVQDRPDPGMYFFAYHDEPIALGIDCAGYIELLMEARGFLYWQKVITALITGSASEEVRRFKEYMPQLFPDFNQARFEKHYSKLAKKQRSRLKTP